MLWVLRGTYQISGIFKLYSAVKDQKDQLDILFANAGIIRYAPLGEISEQHFYKIIDVNVKGLRMMKSP